MIRNLKLLIAFWLLQSEERGHQEESEYHQ